MNSVKNYGVFVTALARESGEQPLSGVSGLLHYSRASPTGQSLSESELGRLKDQSVLSVKVIGWTDQGPSLVRVRDSHD